MKEEKLRIKYAKFRSSSETPKKGQKLEKSSKMKKYNFET